MTCNYFKEGILTEPPDFPFPHGARLRIIDLPRGMGSGKVSERINQPGTIYHERHVGAKRLFAGT